MRNRREPNRYGDWTYLVCNDNIDEPSNFNDAMQSDDSDDWKVAMQNEIDSIIDNNVWTLVKLPHNCKPIDSKWVYKRKIDANGNVERFKARLVAKGFAQRSGLDYDETFAPVVRFESLRTLFSVAMQYDLELHHMDVTSAFLNGDLTEDIYLSQPEGFVVPGKEDCVLKLNKSLYGLKQSPRCWNESLDTFLKELGFTQSSSDSCIYTCSVENDISVIAVYVDDLIIASKSHSRVSQIKAAFSNKYKMKDLGRLNYFLGVNVIQNNDKLFINQTAYASALLKRFNFENSKPVQTPMEPNVKLEKANENSNLCDKNLYQSAVGSLLYISMRTRPDLTYAVNQVARFCSNPTEQHWCAVKRILRYLNGTIDFGIMYSKKHSIDYKGFSDSDWAGDQTDRKSTSGYCFQFSGGVISWRSSKQNCVALSTAEAEYVALAGATQEAIWLSRLLREMRVEINEPIVIFEDNQAAISISNNPTHHPRTKHIDIKYHFVRNAVLNNEITLKYCPTNNMLADIFTKSLSADKFCFLRNMLGMLSRDKFLTM